MEKDVYIKRGRRREREITQRERKRDKEKHRDTKVVTYNNNVPVAEFSV